MPRNHRTLRLLHLFWQPFLVACPLRPCPSNLSFLEIPINMPYSVRQTTASRLISPTALSFISACRCMRCPTLPCEYS
ncbi:hypothetical protein DEU56DRAFT_763251 [Suillus clintonianus]|uniref:uncharacterized protein n=1 Tax=Suillus clintonianus TaxID=1904413 RepID=UPI001B8751C9|nr:uncharacterized protein DEU56DRAFT_763251 [Suillus clintonianus]KAG2157140.1 hypothetical protein DEU56DRAFT_763251 [Suillus clintonianus]